MTADTLPPYARRLGLSVERDDAGTPVLVMPFGDHLLGRPGFLHGGAIAGLLEVAAVAAVRHALGDGRGRVKPVNVTVNYLRGGRAATTRAKGRVLRLGRRVANVEAEAWQDDPAVPIATARMNLIVDKL